MDGVIRGAKTYEGADVQNKRLLVESFSIPDILAETYKGNAFNANTGDITLTSANESAVAYLKNNEEIPLIVTAIGYLMGNSTGGSGDVKIMVVKNPTQGTIITNAVDGDVLINRDFDRTDQISALFYKGVEGDTFTNGIDAYPSLIKDTGAYVIGGGYTKLGTGNSLGILLTPPAGNTSLTVRVFLNIYRLAIEA